MKMKRSISVPGIVVFSLYFLWTTMAIALASPQDESAHAMVMDKGGWVALESKDGGGEIRMEGEGMEIVITPSGAETKMSENQKYSIQVKDETAEGEIVALDSISFSSTTDGKTSIFSCIYYRTRPRDPYVGEADELLALLVPNQQDVAHLVEATAKDKTLVNRPGSNDSAAVIQPSGDMFKAVAGERGMHIMFNLSGGWAYRRLGDGFLADVIVYKRNISFLPGVLTVTQEGEYDYKIEKSSEDQVFKFVFSEGASIGFDEKSGKIVMKNIEQVSLDNPRPETPKSVKTEEEKTAEKPKADNPYGLRTSGIIYGEDPQAIIENVNTNETVVVSEGDSIGGFKVEKIHKNKVVLNDNGKKLVLAVNL